MSDILSKDPGLSGAFPFIDDLFYYISPPILTTIERLELPISPLFTSLAPVCHRRRVVGQKACEDIKKGCNTATYITDFDDLISLSFSLLILPPPHSFMHDPIPLYPTLSYTYTMLMSRTMGSLTYGVSKVRFHPKTRTRCFDFPSPSANPS
jgi:hypothetical protein